MKKGRISGVILGLALVIAGAVQAATFHWTGGASSNDWNDVANWSTSYVPGSTTNDSVLFIGTGDSTTLISPFTFAHASAITLRADAAVTLSANLVGVNQLYLGPNAGHNGGAVVQSAGVVSAQTVRVGNSATATSDSTYTMAGGNLMVSEQLYVNKGIFSLEGSTAVVSADSLVVTSLGGLEFKLGPTGGSPMVVTNELSIDASSTLRIDCSAFTGGEGTYDLVQFGSISETFDAANVVIEGVIGATVVYDGDSLGVLIPSSTGTTVTWDDAAVDNVGWHTAANWSGNILPGSTTNQTVLLDGADDMPHLVQNFNPLNTFDITVRNAAKLSIRANLLNVDDYYLGPNANNGGGQVVHSSGTVSAKQVLVGSSTTATSESLYTISGDASLTTTANLTVGMGIFRIEDSEAVVSVGNDLDLSGGGDLVFEMGEYSVSPIDVANSLTINGSESVLTVDGSFFRGGSGTFELIRFGTISGAFDASNVVINGFKANQSAAIHVDADSLDLTITTDVVTSHDSQLLFTMTPSAGTASADFSSVTLNNGHHASGLDAADLICTQSEDGNDLIYAVSWTGNDFNADGTADTFSFDLRVKAYESTLFSYSSDAASSSITALGSLGDVTESGGRWGVGSDVDLDEGESLYFSVENVQFSVPDYVAELDGFTAFGLNEVSGHTHKHIRGTGIGNNLNSGVINFPKDYSFSGLNPLMVTCAGTANSAGFQVDSINFSVRVHNPELEPVWDVSDYSYTPDGIGYVEPYPVQPAGVDFPEFSWDTVPRWLAVRNINAYSAQQINTIATKYQLVMLEKSNRNGLTYTEEGQLKMAADLKAVSPLIKVITYWNSGLHYTDFEADNSYDIEKWSVVDIDSNGDVTYSLQRGTQYKYDHSNKDLRNWWVNVPLTMAFDENVDGVFIDVPKAANPHFYDENGEPQTDSTLMYDALRTQMPANKMLVGNSLRVSDVNGHRQSLECFDGSYLENWTYTYGYFESLNGDHSDRDAIRETIQLMREALARGKMINLQSGPEGPGIEDDPAPAGSANMAARRAYAQKYVKFPLAVFLIVAEENAYFGYNMGVNAIEESYNDDVWDTSFLDEFNRPLGAPLGDSTRDGYVFTRSYEHVDVRLDVDSKETVFAWDSVDADEDGLNDLWEYRNFGDTTAADPTGNPDGDELNNHDEYIAGTNPNLPSSFEISDWAIDESVQLEWDAVDGRYYNVYWSSNLVSEFTLVGSNLVDGLFIDTTAERESQGFYKITVELEP